VTEKPVFFVPLLLKTEHLPRQARDKHRESSEKRLPGSRNYGFEAGPPPGSDWPPLSINDSVIKEWDLNR
jgi:hypothetical protein